MHIPPCHSLALKNECRWELNPQLTLHLLYQLSYQGSYSNDHQYEGVSHQVTPLPLKEMFYWESNP